MINKSCYANLVILILIINIIISHNIFYTITFVSYIAIECSKIVKEDLVLKYSLLKART